MTDFIRQGHGKVHLAKGQVRGEAFQLVGACSASADIVCNADTFTAGYYPGVRLLTSEQVLRGSGWNIDLCKRCAKLIGEA